MYFSLARPDGIESRVGLLPVRVGGRRVVIAVAQRLGLRARILREAREAMVIALPLALLGVTGGGFLLARQGLRPVAAMRERAERIEAATLHERLPVGPAPQDELGRLAIVFNALLERLDRAFEQQRRFMADASHELRTPVAVVRGEAEHALATARTEIELRDALDVVRDEADRMTHVVDDLFLLARADAGEQPILVEELYLDDLVGESVRAVRTLAAPKGITVVSDAEPDLQVRGDAALLRRLVLTLLDNAIKYTPACGRVTVRARRDASFLRLAVSDTGPGIPADLRSQVFERFYRAPRDRGKRETQGAGLGLAIVRWVARAHGGDARVASSGPEGTTIEVSLPGA
jgi:heavy metal sensor kinase